MLQNDVVEILNRIKLVVRIQRGKATYCEVFGRVFFPLLNIIFKWTW